MQNQTAPMGTVAGGETETSRWRFAAAVVVGFVAWLAVGAAGFGILRLVLPGRLVEARRTV